MDHSILMVLDEPFPPDIRVENEARSLIGAGFRVTVLSIAPPARGTTQSGEERWNGIDIIRVRIRRQLRNKMRGLVASVPALELFVSHHILRVCRQRHVDVLHMHDLWLFGAGLRASRRLGIPVVGDLHENFTHALTQYAWSTRFPGKWVVNIKRWKKLEKQWMQALGCLICIVQEQQDRVIKLGVPRSRCVLWPNTISVQAFDSYEVDQELVASLRSDFTIVYTGGINLHRGLDTLLKAMPAVLRHCDARLVIVGEGRIRPELEELADSLGIAGRVSFTGWQKLNLIKSYILGADVGVVPHVKSTHTDAGMPHKLFQYLYLKRPAVVSDCIPMQRIVEGNQCGLVFPSGDAGALGEALLTLYHDPELRARMGMNGCKAVVSRYNWDATAQPAIAMYRGLFAAA